VWQQLRQLCDQSPLCAPARLAEVNRELQQLPAEVAALRQHNTQLQEANIELEDLREEVTAMRQRNTQLEQQLVQAQGERRVAGRGSRRG
jgi:predicted nuclease with TOPRIM domain